MIALRKQLTILLTLIVNFHYHHQVELHLKAILKVIQFINNKLFVRKGKNKKS